MFKSILKVNFNVIMILVILPVSYLVLYIFFQNVSTLKIAVYEITMNIGGFRSSLIRTFYISLIVSFISTISSFFLCINFNKNTKFLLISLIIFLFIVPSTIQSIGLNLLVKHVLFIKKSTYLSLIFSLISYTIPYSFLVLITSITYINKKFQDISADLGIPKIVYVKKIQVPLLTYSFLSAFILSFLLSFNEYQRTFFLGSSFDLLSTKIYGALQSGLDANSFLISIINLSITGACIFIVFIGLQKSFVNKS